MNKRSPYGLRAMRRFAKSIRYQQMVQDQLESIRVTDDGTIFVKIREHALEMVMSAYGLDKSGARLLIADKYRDRDVVLVFEDHTCKRFYTVSEGGLSYEVIPTRVVDQSVHEVRL